MLHIASTRVRPPIEEHRMESHGTKEYT